MIKIICVGKIKEKFYREAIKEFEKRLSKYTKLEIIEVSDFGSNDTEVNKKKEATEILKHIRQKDYVITLEVTGKEYDSLEFSNHLDTLFLTNSNITFIIGGSDGIGKDINSLKSESISFSKLTFPHQLFRIFLLEQIYRSYKIINNENYHK